MSGASRASGCRVVFFDFFGTLVHYSPSRTEQGFERSFSVLRNAGSTLDYDAFLALWSDVSESFEAAAAHSLEEFSMRELAGAFFDRAVPTPPTDAIVGEFVSTYLAEWNTGVRPIAGVSEMLGRLAQRYRLAVITNTHDAGLVPGHLQALGLARHFEAVITSVEFGRRKPHPAIFEHALETLGVPPEEAIHVGDDPIADVRGGTGAGLRSYWIDSSPGRREENAVARLGSIVELESHLVSSDTRSSGGGAW